jgi:exodeoxyribonuclease X
MATHHIMDEDLVDCPPPSDFTLPPDVDYLVGHNIDFDWRVIGEPSVKRICTLALCREIYPEIDSHSLSAMFYHLYRDKARERLEHAHSALADTFLCRDILVKIVDHLGVTTWDALYQASESARIPKVMPFGKHKGVAIADVPRDYKAWLLRQPDVDAYLIEAFKA